MPHLPDDLLAAIESVVLTAEELLQLIELEARALGLTVDEAIKQAEAGELPATPVGTDLKFLLTMLPVGV